MSNFEKYMKMANACSDAAMKDEFIRKAAESMNDDEPVNTIDGSIELMHKIRAKQVNDASEVLAVNILDAFTAEWVKNADLRMVPEPTIDEGESKEDFDARHHAWYVEHSGNTRPEMAFDPLVIKQLGWAVLRGLTTQVFRTRALADQAHNAKTLENPEWRWEGGTFIDSNIVDTTISQNEERYRTLMNQAEQYELMLRAFVRVSDMMEDELSKDEMYRAPSMRPSDQLDLSPEAYADYIRPPAKGSRMPNANLRPQQSELLTANVDLLDNLYNTGLHFLAPPTEIAQKDVETDAKKEQFNDACPIK